MSRRAARATVVVSLLSALAGLVTARRVDGAESPAAGSMLVATPKIPDPDFAGTVILIVYSGQQGVIGLILNRATGFPVCHLFPEMRSTAAGNDKVYLGGMIALGVRALFRSSSPRQGAQHLFNDVWMLSSGTEVEKAVRAGERAHVFRVYAGYTGWSEGQLRKELLLGHWRVLPGDAAIVFDPRPETLWKRLSSPGR